jgi:hypothetical protein
MTQSSFRRAWWLALGMCFFLLIGCYSKPKYGGKPIKGTITYNGFPVERGAIQFIDWDDAKKEMIQGPGHPTPSAPITKGKYVVDDILPGKKVIVFRSTAGDDYEGRDNTFAEVTGEKNQVIDFNLMPPTTTKKR